MSTRIVLRSSESQKLFPDNKPYSFTVELPKWLSFPDMSSWTIQLSEFYAGGVGNNTRKELLVFCNVCETSIVGEQYRPLLRRIFSEGGKNHIFFRPYEVPIKDNGFQSLHFEIKDKDYQPAFFLTGEVSMTLEFKQKWTFIRVGYKKWCTPIVIFDGPDENDTIGLEVMAHLFWEKNTRLDSHTRSGNGTGQTNLGQQKEDLMDEKQIMTYWKSELYKVYCYFFHSTKTMIASEKMNLNKIILAWNFC